MKIKLTRRDDYIRRYSIEKGLSFYSGTSFINFQPYGLIILSILNLQSVKFYLQKIIPAIKINYNFSTILFICYFATMAIDGTL